MPFRRRGEFLSLAIRTSIIAALVTLTTISIAYAQSPDPGTNGSSPSPVACQSRPGERMQCAADTAAGVVLIRSVGAAPCLLGKTWGYDQISVWVADGCSGEFLVGQPAAAQETPKKPLEQGCPSSTSAGWVAR